MSTNLTAIVIALGFQILELRPIGAPSTKHAFQQVWLVANQPREMAVPTFKWIYCNTQFKKNGVLHGSESPTK